MDVTNHLDDKDKAQYVGFLPNQEIKLVLNAKTNQHVQNFWYVVTLMVPSCIASGH